MPSSNMFCPECGRMTLTALANGKHLKDAGNNTFIGLRVLNVEQVDMLMLRDSPDCAVMQSQWRAMEAALAAKRTRAIGLINYCESSLACILATAKTKPAVNYFMRHVGMGPDPEGLTSYCRSKGNKEAGCPGGLAPHVSPTLAARSNTKTAKSVTIDANRR